MHYPYYTTYRVTAPPPYNRLSFACSLLSGVVVGLQQATYSVDEGSGPLSVCALLNATAERNVVVSLLAISLTAQGRV